MTAFDRRSEQGMEFGANQKQKCHANRGAKPKKGRAFDMRRTNPSRLKSAKSAFLHSWFFGHAAQADVQVTKTLESVAYGHSQFWVISILDHFRRCATGESVGASWRPIGIRGRSGSAIGPNDMRFLSLEGLGSGHPGPSAFLQPAKTARAYWRPIAVSMLSGLRRCSASLFAVLPIS